MAKIVDGDNKFPKSKIGKTPFLTSLRDFKPEGVKLGVERVSRVFSNHNDPEKANITVELIIMEDMPKCRLYELDDDGQYIEVLDELTGKKSKQLVIGEVKKDDFMTFPVYMNCGKVADVSDDADLTFYPTSSAYPLFKLALQECGELPENMPNKAFVTNQKELKEALEGFTFLGKCEEVHGSFNYVRLAVEHI